MRAAHLMPFGAALLAQGGVRFRLWAPDADAMQLELHQGEPRRLAMPRGEDGWHALDVPEAGVGTGYRFVTPAGLAVPDPASRSNPRGVHAPSVVLDPGAYRWGDRDWRGRPWHEAVVLEVHVGTFTPQGSFAALAERLPAIAAQGFSAIELMPLAQFAGARGWGYDGVLPFAPHAAYGTPDDLRRLVDTAHGHGLMVLLDVVYNHFGPEGNYLGAYCSPFFDPRRATPWGAAINFDGAGSRTVRDFFVHNALYWIEEFRFDGLRMDAVHAIADDSVLHIAQEIGEALRAFGAAAEPPRHVHLVLEDEANLAWLLERDERGRPVAADAQWNDDLHHAAHVLATGETDGYYADYADDPLSRLGRCFAEGFGYQGEASALRGGALRGEPSGHLPAPAFVGFLQNHDQVGNRAFGERLDALVGARPGGPQAVEALLVALLLSPQVPMLFMGEERGARAPFLYFCDFEGELAEAVRKGRRAEFGRFAAFRDPAARARIPDPNARATFAACVLHPEELAGPAHTARATLVQGLLAARAVHLTPRLALPTLGGTHTARDGLLQVRWVLGDGALWTLALNLGERAAPLPQAGALVQALRADAAGLAPRGVRVSIEEASP